MNTDQELRSLVQEKGQVTVPIELRRRWKLSRGDLIAFVVLEDGLLLFPQRLDAPTGEIVSKFSPDMRTKNITNDRLGQLPKPQPEKPQI